MGVCLDQTLKHGRPQTEGVSCTWGHGCCMEMEAGGWPYNMTGNDVCKLLITSIRGSHFHQRKEMHVAVTIQDIFKTLNFWHVPYVTSLNGF